jgi:hypothetical protein
LEGRENLTMDFQKMGFSFYIRELVKNSLGVIVCFDLVGDSYSGVVALRRVLVLAGGGTTS